MCNTLQGEFNFRWGREKIMCTFSFGHHLRLLALHVGLLHV